MKKIFWISLILCLVAPLCLYAIDGSDFDADKDGDVDGDDLAGFAQYFGTLRYYKDFDGDDHSDGTTLYSTSQPTNYYLESELNSTAGDCDDEDANVNPGMDEVCDDGIDNECDGDLDCDDSDCTVDPACSCIADDNPTCSGSTYYLGSVNGDQGADTLSDTWWNEEWVYFSVYEDNSLFDKYLSADISLYSPPNIDFDLYVYCDSCVGSLAGSSTVRSQSGHWDTIQVRKDDNWGTDDSFEVIVEIRYHSGSVCGGELGSWVLNVAGNTSVSSATCN